MSQETKWARHIIDTFLLIEIRSELHRIMIKRWYRMGEIADK